MNIINHPLCTSLIGAPSDMPEPACSALPVAYREDEHGKWTVSFWQPEANELAQLAAGGAIALHVRASGRQHPVVAMEVEPYGVPAAEQGEEQMLTDWRAIAEGHALEAARLQSELDAALDRRAPRSAQGDALQTPLLPDLNEELGFILGRPNFTCIRIADRLRQLGQEIEHKAEAEQAAVIYLLLTMYLKHGDKWEDATNSYLKAVTADTPPAVNQNDAVDPNHEL